jgi:hypothetical protein
VAATCCAGALLVSCAPPPAGDEETDRQSRTLAEAIAYPRQPDAAGFARAAMATTLGRSGTFSVLEAVDLEHERPEDPMARLVWRIHVEGYDYGMSERPTFDACYTVEFNYYEASSGPSRIHCPEGATPVRLAPTPRRDIPPEFSPALEAVLARLPATPAEADVRAALRAGLPPPPVDAETGLARVPPEVFVHVEGPDVGVALFARTGVEDKDCVLGQRKGGTVAVWSLNWRELREASCDGEAALAH